jgi:hypothetical protein
MDLYAARKEGTLTVVRQFITASVAKHQDATASSLRL